MYIVPNIAPEALALARACVARGVRWFDAQAKVDQRFKGWRLEMVNIYGGRVSSVVHMEYDTNGPLTLACKWDRNLVGPNPWVSEGGPMKYFGFTTRSGKKRAFLLGFHEGTPADVHCALQINIDIVEYCSALNVAWAEALQEYRTEVRPEIGYPAGYFRRVA